MNPSMKIIFKRLSARLLTCLGMLLLCMMAIACKKQETVPAQTPPPAPPAVSPPESSGRPFRIGMGAMLTPREGFTYYRQLKDYIERRFGQPIQLIDRGNYTEINRLLEIGDIDAAFVCSGPYVEGKERFGLQLLAMPLVKGEPIYHSYIIVPSNSPARTFDDLRGKVFAFTDPKSNTGKLVPTYMLARKNETPEHFFSKIEFTYGHDNSIRAVAEQLVDGAAIDGLVWEYMALKAPDVTARTRILLRSEPFGIPPFVVRPGIPAEQKQKLKQILFHAADEEEGRRILKGMMIDGFVPGDDRNYDTIRAMNVWLAKQGKKP